MGSQQVTIRRAAGILLLFVLVLGLMIVYYNSALASANAKLPHFKSLLESCGINFPLLNHKETYLSLV